MKINELARDFVALPKIKEILREKDYLLRELCIEILCAIVDQYNFMDILYVFRHLLETSSCSLFYNQVLNGIIKTSNLSNYEDELFIQILALSSCHKFLNQESASLIEQCLIDLYKKDRSRAEFILSEFFPHLSRGYSICPSSILNSFLWITGESAASIFIDSNILNFLFELEKEGCQFHLIICLLKLWSASKVDSVQCENKMKQIRSSKSKCLRQYVTRF